ncbi:unnamed protein product [Trifolium pratense]|uniref:Uncharacterized protein n=1 Tax=Trifolium pratense TaxID=57577 RepID=A0ACB0LLZ0_TRIPR|nr:unnamed protein product [Trifolium pratense]
MKILSTTTINAPNQSLGDSTTDRKIHLNPWDLQFLPFGANQTAGLLYKHPLEKIDTINQIIHQLKCSLSSTLAFFPLLAGRLEITEHENDNTISCYLKCNNAGVLFVHAVEKNVAVADILRSTCPPQFIQSLFPLNGIKNYEGTSQPLLAVQVTELIDGIFLALTINHVVIDGKPTWNFINSWAEISKLNGCLQISKLPTPTLERWFPNAIQLPIRFPFTIEKNHAGNDGKEKLNPPERLFHFTKEKIMELKSKANIEAESNNISSLQALLTHIWRSVVLSRGFDPQEEVQFMIVIDTRSRFFPPLPEDYFGNAIILSGVSMKVGELLKEGGLGKGAREMNKMIASHTNEKLKNHYESWLKTPSFIRLGSVANSNSLVVSSSPRFNVYECDFGWGKPLRVRSGDSNKRNGKISVYPGAEEGSVDIEVCLPYEILEAMENDPEFMGVVSN